MKMSKEIWKELEQRSERRKQTVMAAEGKNPLGQHIKLERSDTLPQADGKNLTIFKRYDAPVVIVAKLEHGTIWILEEDGTPCLASENPHLRDAHWYLSTKFVGTTKKHMPHFWMVAGFWTINARSEIYDLAEPFQLFEVGDGEGYVEPYEDLRAWGDTFGIRVCPLLEVDPSEHVGTNLKCIAHISNDLGFVEERYIVGGEYGNTARYRTNTMPYGLVQYNYRPPIYSKGYQVKLYLKQMGLPY